MRPVVSQRRQKRGLQGTCWERSISLSGAHHAGLHTELACGDGAGRGALTVLWVCCQLAELGLGAGCGHCPALRWIHT